MKRFVVPPNWPTPPRRSWVPPKTWRPDPAWPPAPEDWDFWVDGKGNAVRGPVGLYGGPPRRMVIAGAGGVAAVLVLALWGLSTFDSGPPPSQAAPILDDRSPTPSLTPTPTGPPPSVRPSVTPPPKPTTKPTVVPTKTRTTRAPEHTEERDPKPTKTTTTVPQKPRPPRTTPTRTMTREELLAEYCRQRGWDPDWCDPDNWQDPDDPRSTPTDR
ncbi:hypothetical protein [Kribbella sp. DT2]|uniref:hypothetical protein n=1 Tax=Kribbella sp. DT2 TaxID=3393427 RepID=UPI003CFA7619